MALIPFHPSHLEHLIQNPSFDAVKDHLKYEISTADETSLRPLWAHMTGVCTSWTIYIAQAIEEISNTTFEHGDRAGHRAAWAMNAFAIDSSARSALNLGNGKVKSAFGTSWRMDHIHTPKAILLSGKQGSETRPFKPLHDHLEAMKCCLLQLLTQKGDMQFFSLYRKVEDGKLRFNGTIIWTIQQGKTTIALGDYSPAPDGALKKTTRYATFSKNTEPSEEEDQRQKRLQEQFFRFSYKQGRLDRFKLVEDVFKEIWLACSHALAGRLGARGLVFVEGTVTGAMVLTAPRIKGDGNGVESYCDGCAVEVEDDNG